MEPSVVAREETDQIDAELRQLRISVGVLSDRVSSIETVLWRTGVSVGILALLAGLVTPFLIGTDRKKTVTVTLIGMAVGSKADADDGGPFSGEANILSFLLGLLAVGTVVAVVILFAVGKRRMSATALKWCTGLAVTYLVGAIGTWFVVGLLAQHADSVSPLSPATMCLTVGAVLTTLLVTKGRDLIDIQR